MTVRNGKTNEEIRNRLGITSVFHMVPQGRLGWFGHVECKDEGGWVSACTKHGSFRGKR
jgi:hypothetical protein